MHPNKIIFKKILSVSNTNTGEGACSQLGVNLVIKGLTCVHYYGRIASRVSFSIPLLKCYMDRSVLVEMNVN